MAQEEPTQTAALPQTTAETFDAAPLAEAPGAVRVAGVDVARALAAIIMIQGHGYHAYATEEARSTTAYAITRFFGTFPLPAFLLLSGASLALRFRIALLRDEDPAPIRTRVVFRGAQLVFIGYLTQLLFGWIDGWDSIDTLLRADVLQCIGLSLMFLGTLWPHRGACKRKAWRHWLLRCGILGLLVSLLCPPLSQLGATTQGPFRFVVAPFIGVPSITRMPVVPLLAWTSAGALAVAWLMRMAPTEPTPRQASQGATTGRLLWLGALGVTVATASAVATDLWMPEEGLVRTHPIVWFNVADLLGRGLVVLSFGALLAGLLPSAPRKAMVKLGQGSLWAYVFHLPFCYGYFGSTMAGKLTMLEASGAVAGLLLLSYGAAAMRPRILERWRVRRPPSGTRQVSS